MSRWLFSLGIAVIVILMLLTGWLKVLEFMNQEPPTHHHGRHHLSGDPEP